MPRTIALRMVTCAALGLACILSFTACNQSTAQNAAGSAGAVKLEIKTWDEVQAVIKGHAGKIVVMDTWSTSCEPCMKEFPGLVALHKKYGPDKVACISLSCDYSGVGKPEEVAPPVLEFLQKQNATFQNFLSKDDDSSLFTKLDIPSIPALFIYGKDGKLAKKIDGDFQYKDVEPIVAGLLK